MRVGTRADPPASRPRLQGDNCLQIAQERTGFRYPVDDQRGGLGRPDCHRLTASMSTSPAICGIRVMLAIRAMLTSLGVMLIIPKLTQLTNCAAVSACG